jgi:GTPase
MFDTEIRDEKLVTCAFLVGIKNPDISTDEANEHLSELGELVDTMGLEVTGNCMVNLRSPNTRYYVGSGKVEEIALFARQSKAECIVVDFELSPSQQRNWEKQSGLCVIDRHEVILDIFAARATTKEAVIQVALARMQYSLPRLKRAWTHLSRQRGGMKGTRGEGEKQLEVDRRLVLNRITHLKKELKEVSKHREIQRAKREGNAIPLAAIVGYTNVGKSSLLNLLSDANIFVEDKLFATLDPTTRLVLLPEKQKILLTDTVGLIRKLPHNLVEAFKSTLEETLAADFIIHVLDVSSHNLEQHWETTISLLGELNALDKPSIVVYNKTDKLDSPIIKTRLRALKPNALFISVKTGEGIEMLKNKLLEQLNAETILMQLELPHDNYEITARLYKIGRIISTRYEEDITYITVRLPKKYVNIYSKYSV